jgi:PBSX family phage terminase large subunit
MKQARAIFKFKPFSKKQRKVLNWWCDNSPVKDYDGIIADGAIRSGKTVSMSLSFVLWAMSTFNCENFGMCGKTVGSFRSNVLFSLKIMLSSRGYTVIDKRSENLCIIKKDEVENYFYIFGGKDERSQDLIQGITLAGLLLDEVALMPESFVNQATGRCSVDGSKIWFNCNPENPSHWFKVNWIDKLDEKRLLYLHFTMDDNLSLSDRVKERYKRMYVGVFFERFILGLWTLAQGVIYAMYKDALEEPPEDVKVERYCLSIDYGTMNAFSAGLWGKYGTVWYRLKEYYYSGRDTGIQKTDEEYGKALDDLIRPIMVEREAKSGIYLEKMETIIDPSAASFITLLRKKSWYKVTPADNAVLDGIRETASAIQTGKIKISPSCKNWIKEAQGYVWDDKESEDKPVKVNDHAMDDTRYFVKTKRIAVHKSFLGSGSSLYM